MAPQSKNFAWRSVARFALPKALRHRLGQWYGELGIERCPDRVYLTREIFPAVAARGGRMLFVGCRPYTRRYPALLEQHGGECWTLDVDPAVARWGARNRHVTRPVQEALACWPESSFDTVVLNGVFGYGLDQVEDQETALRVCRMLLKLDGWFVLGWNTDRCADPSGLPALKHHFRPASLGGLPMRQSFPHSTHVFDLFQAATPVDSQSGLSGPAEAASGSSVLR